MKKAIKFNITNLYNIFIKKLTFNKINEKSNINL